MRLIKWLWSIATGSMPDTTGKPQGSTRPCLCSHSSPANASSALPLRLSLVLAVFTSHFFPFRVVCCSGYSTSSCKNKKKKQNEHSSRNKNKTFNKTATFDGFTLFMTKIDFSFKTKPKKFFRKRRKKKLV